MRLGTLLFAAGLLAAPSTQAQAPDTGAPASPAAAAATAAATDAPRPIQLADYDRWRTIRNVELSSDGRWVTFSYEQRRTDGVLVVRNLESGAEHEVERGTSPAFSDDGRFLAFLVPPTLEEAEKLEEDGKPVPRAAGLLELSSGDRWSWEDASEVSFSPSSSHLAVRKRKADREAEHDGTALILRNLAEAYEEVLGHVDAFAFNESGTHLAYTVSAPDRDGNGVVVMELATGARRALDNAREDYRRLTWDPEEGTALAVLRGLEVEDHVERQNVLLAWPRATAERPEPVVLQPDSVDGFPQGLVVSEKSELTWSEDLGRVFFGLREQRPEAPDADADPDAPRADVDIWHWADDRIQSVQMVQANRDRNRTHAAVLHTRDGRFVQLSDSTLTGTSLSPDGRWVVAEDDRAYVHDWQPRYRDHYRVDPATGERTLFLEAHLRTLGFSPDGGRYLYWKDEDVWAYDLAQDEHRNLTARTPASFVDEDFDRWGEKPPHGIAGWASRNRGVILESRFDLWLVPLDGSEGRSLTAGRGEAEQIRFRYVELDPDAEWVDLDRPLLLSAFGDRDKRAGFYRLNGDRLEELVYEDAWFGRPTKADAADRILFTRESFREFPDLWVSGPDFGNGTRVTDANPHLDEYLQGTRILFDYVTVRGDTLQGTLAIPDDYVSGERRAMLVNYYERNSQNLNRHPTLNWAHRPQFARFVSHGYLVMQPDIAFHLGDTHSQMQDAILAAVDRVIEMGYADPERIGLQGHSFSGQGSAHIATQTDRFQAILAGAAATNLVSDFNQLWKTSGTNQHRYDTYGQGRFATNPFDDLELYVSQSAVHHAASMNTPLLLLHGTDDGSVEWLQAVEFYNALRFFEKPVILVSYPGEGHGLRSWDNQRDFQVRLNQFFDHHLLGREAPDWMLHGVPHLDKPYHVAEELPLEPAAAAASPDDGDRPEGL